MKLLVLLFLTFTLIATACTKPEEESEESSSSSSLPGATFSDANATTMKLTRNSSTALAGESVGEYRLYPVNNDGEIFAPVTFSGSDAEGVIDRSFSYIVTGVINERELCFAFVAPLKSANASTFINREQTSLCYLALTSIYDDDVKTIVFANPHLFTAFVMRAAANKARSGEYPVHILLFANELYAQFLEFIASDVSNSDAIYDAVARLYEDSVSSTLMSSTGYDMALDEIMADLGMTAFLEGRDAEINEYASIAMTADPVAFKEDYLVYVEDALQDYKATLTTEQQANFDRLAPAYVATIWDQVEDGAYTSADALLAPTYYESGDFATMDAALDTSDPVVTDYVNNDTQTYYDSIDYTVSDPCAEDAFADSFTTYEGGSTDSGTGGSIEGPMTALADPCSKTTTTTGGPTAPVPPGRGGQLLVAEVSLDDWIIEGDTGGGAGGGTSGGQCKITGELGCSSDADCCGELVCCGNLGAVSIGGIRACGELRIELFGVRSCK